MKEGVVDNIFIVEVNKSDKIVLKKKTVKECCYLVPIHDGCRHPDDWG